MRLQLLLVATLGVTSCESLDPSRPSLAGRSQQQEYGQAAGGKTVPLASQDAHRLKQLMTPLVAKMDHPIPMDQVKVTVMAEPHINAANGGGGDFYVSEGLLKKASDEQLQAILAHEIAHADLGHVNKVQTVAAGVGVGAALLGQIWPGSEQLAPIAGQLLVRSYSRAEETAADKHAVTLMRRNGQDGKQMMIDALTWLQNTEGGSSGGFFSTHPATGSRIQELQNMA